MIDGAQILVNAPTRAPLPYGLLSVVQTPTDEDQTHWQNGIRFDNDTCTEAQVTTDSCAATGTGNKTPTETWQTRMASPFTVYSMPICAPVGNLADYEARVTSALTSGEARAVEREFWTGAKGTLPHLAANVAVTGTGFDSAVIKQTAATTVTGAPVDIVEAISLLSGALATCYGNEGVIHVPPQALAHMAARQLLTKDGTRLRTPAGHLVAAGAGYPGTAPDGTAPTGGIFTLYATGAVMMRRTPIILTSTPNQAVDRAKNDVVLVAERTYVLGWDCCHFAQQVRLGGEISGTVGTPN